MEMLREEGSIRRGLDWKSNYFLLNGRIFVDKLDNPLSTINDPPRQEWLHTMERLSWSG